MMRSFAGAGGRQCANCRLPFVLGLLLVLAPVSFAQAGTQVPNPSATLSAKIQSVETGLTPHVQIKGGPAVHWSLHERMAYFHVPAVSVAVINHGSLEWAKAYGVKDAGGSDSADRETLFQAASVSKVVTALTTLRLIQLKRIGLDDDVNQRLVHWKLPNSSGHPVTIAELLSHSAAINFPAGETALPPSDPLPTLLQRLNGEAPALNRPVHVDGVPGSGFRYSNGGYLVLGQLISDVTDEDFPHAAQELVLDPLKMKHSTFDVLTPDGPRKDIAVGHTDDGAPEDGKWRVVGGPEGGLWTTASDLAQAVAAIEAAYQGTGAKFLPLPLAYQLLTKQNDQWGLGVQLQGSGDTLAFRHDGSTPGYKAVLFGYANRGQGIVILTNGDRGGELADEILYSVAAAYDWPDFQVLEKQVAVVEPQLLKQYVGRYQMAPGAFATITLENGALYGEVRGRDKTRLYPEAENKFFMIEGPTVEFVKDGAGNVTALIFDGSFRANKTP
jgi:CubicO group peptidase (beta-lactamase class C family)